MGKRGREKRIQYAEREKEWERERVRESEREWERERERDKGQKSDSCHLQFLLRVDTDSHCWICCLITKDW
jgi:hypothetical protein